MTYKTVYVNSKLLYRERHRVTLPPSTVTEPAAVDPVELAEHIEDACNQLAGEGYEIVTITPINSGDFTFIHQGGAGWSYTTGVVITAKKLS